MWKTARKGAWATCVCLALTATAATAQTAAPEIVLYQSDATTVAGPWTRTADATAAGGVRLASTDAGWSSVNTALQAPSRYVEFSFAAPPNTAYHLWVRMRAAGNDKFNDSLYAQFSDAASPAGAALYRIGTTSALTLNLQLSSGAKLNNWGWVDGAYWLAQQSVVTFTGSGLHTLRLQVREDGVMIDQVVLSPATYLAARPGQASGDSTIVAKPAALPAPVPTPYSGTAIALPGTVEAEHYDNGGQNLAYVDSDAANNGGAFRQGSVDLEAATEGAYDVGWIAPGEWLAYSVNVTAGGRYLLEARVASAGQGGTFHVEFGGTNVTQALTIPDTGGWQQWTTVSTMVTLQAGPQVARVVFDTAGVAVGNLNWFRVSPVTATPFGGTPLTLPGTVAMDRFDNGGQGVAYFDTSAGNAGGVARAADVDLELSSLGVPDIGWTADGEWVQYSVTVAAAGTYKVTAKVASPYDTGRLRLTVGSVTLATQAVPNTGGWQAWRDMSWTATLNAGAQPLTIVVDAGGFNVASLVVEGAVTATAGPTAPPPPPPAPTAPTGQTIYVNQGDDLQAAINAAQPGDRILLQAGATFAGNFTLPAKTGTASITIRTNIADPVPAGTRITPATAVNLAKIKSPNTFTALATAPYARNYVLQLLEFPANVGGFGEVISLGDGSSAQNSLAMVPGNILVDRVYVHGDGAGQKRGIGLNSASTTIRDSYIANIWYVGQDSQAIAGWNGPGPYTIHNNYLEAASENFLLGGADPAIVDLIPSDITFTKNHLTKPLAWMARADINVKNLFELKNAQRVTIDGNVFENNWMAAQAGYALVFTGRSQDGTAPWSVVQDLTFTNNIVRNVASAINILGKDYYFPSGTSSRFVFRNNLFDNISRASFGGNGRFLLVNGGVDFTFDHNTIIQDGASVVYADTNAVSQFTFTNNIAPDHAWAIMGGGTSPGNGTIATFFPSSTFLRGVWAGSNLGSYPTGNYYPPTLDAVGFMSLANRDYRLAPDSPYRGSALDGTDVGANIDQVLAATAGVK